jgi:hypothetical protein
MIFNRKFSESFERNSRRLSSKIFSKDWIESALNSYHRSNVITVNKKRTWESKTVDSRCSQQNENEDERKRSKTI